MYYLVDGSTRELKIVEKSENVAELIGKRDYRYEIIRESLYEFVKATLPIEYDAFFMWAERNKDSDFYKIFIEDSGSLLGAWMSEPYGSRHQMSEAAKHDLDEYCYDDYVCLLAEIGIKNCDVDYQDFLVLDNILYNKFNETSPNDLINMIVNERRRMIEESIYKKNTEPKRKNYEDTPL